MANIKLKNIDKYIKQLRELDATANNMIGEAIFEGADVVADNTKKALKGIRTDDSPRQAWRNGIRTVEKNALIESFGIAPLRNDKDFLNVKTGFDGYNGVVTRNWPKGAPNVLIARALESGTSFMPKQPVITKATQESRKQCLEAMRKSVEKSINKVMK